MIPSPAIRKVFQGVASRHQMFRMFDRHAQRPNRWDGDASPLYAGEWFEISETEHDYMFEILPPLWIRGSMFAMREFSTGSVTSVFFILRVDATIRHFHGYCDLLDAGSVERMRVAIIERESRPVRAMTREERLEHIGRRGGGRSCRGDDRRVTLVNSRALLATMEASRRQTHHHLDLVHRQIAGRAERLTVTEKAKSRSHRRGRSNSTPSDEELYRDHLDRLTFQRRGEIDALSRKLARQDQALAAVYEKLGINAGGAAA